MEHRKIVGKLGLARRYRFTSLFRIFPIPKSHSECVRPYELCYISTILLLVFLCINPENDQEREPILNMNDPRPQS